MALSQDEQRMLAEIERRLAADDPGLASCLTTFRRPGPATVLRSPRARIIGSLFTVLLVAMVSLMVYAMVPFRTHVTRPSPPTSAAANTTTSAATSSEPDRTYESSAGASTSDKSATSQGAPTRSTGPTTTGKAQQAKGQPTNTAMLPETSP
jgi:cytoskeletal protein RodZ